MKIGRFFEKYCYLLDGFFKIFWQVELEAGLFLSRRVSNNYYRTETCTCVYYKMFKIKNV
jgi:hypothetical protein